MLQLEKSINEHPGNIGVLNLKGFLLQHQKQFDQAAQVFASVIARAKNEVNGYINLANVYSIQQKYEQALKIYEDGLNQLPKNVDLMQNQALIYEKMGKFDSAIAIYKELLNVVPNSKAVINNLAALTAETTNDPKKLAEALALVKAFKDFKDPAFLDTYGWLSYLNGQYDDAVSALEKVVKLHPDFAEFNYHLGLAYAAKGRKEEAKLALQKSIDKSEKASWVVNAKAKLTELK